MWFGLKVFRFVSLDLTGYICIIIGLVHLKLVNLFIELCCQVHYWTLKVRFYVVKIYFLSK